MNYRIGHYDEWFHLRIISVSLSLAAAGTFLPVWQWIANTARLRAVDGSEASDANVGVLAGGRAIWEKR